MSGRPTKPAKNSKLRSMSDAPSNKLQAFVWAGPSTHAFCGCSAVLFLGIQQKNAETALELDPPRRIACAEQLVREQPHSASAHQQLGNSYSFGHREAEAVKECQKAVQLSCGEVSPGLYFSLANALLATGQRTQAREALKQEVASDAPLCQVVLESQRSVAEVECSAWVEAKEMLRKSPAK